MERAIGIDLGTYNSTGAFALGKEQVIMIESRYGRNTHGKNFPSFVLFDQNGKKLYVGNWAKEQLEINPKLVVWGVKRLVGLSYDAAKNSGEFSRFQYDIEKGQNGLILIKVGEERYTPSHILEFILREIREDAENTLINPLAGGKIENAVISVPAYFDGTRVNPIIDAAKNAGFKEIHTISEPTAAAIQAGLDVPVQANVLTFDMGAGTLDVSIILLLNNGGTLIQGELAVSGNEKLGGIDINEAITSDIVHRYGLTGIENNPRSYAMLRQEIENAKIRLSTETMTDLDLPDGKSVSLTRDELESMIAPLLERCRGPIRIALKEAKLKASEIDHILFVGGPTYMPSVKALVIDELRKLGARENVLTEYEKLLGQGKTLVNPMECVARGAALKSAGLVEPDMQKDPSGYGTLIAVPGYPDQYFESVIPTNSSYPTSGTMKILQKRSNSRQISIPIIKKLQYDENGEEFFRYFLLGSYFFYLKPRNEDPQIEISLDLTSDKVLTATFTHMQTKESVKFENLNNLVGVEVPLQEAADILAVQPVIPDFMHPPREPQSGIPASAPATTNIPGTTPSGSIGPAAPASPSPGWSMRHLLNAKRAGTLMIEEFTRKTKDQRVIARKTDLLFLMEKIQDPDDTNRILNKEEELLDALKNAGLIEEDAFFMYLNTLREIDREMDLDV
jgi:molecular chaperone DnaK